MAVISFEEIMDFYPKHNRAIYNDIIHSVILGPKCTVDVAQLTLFLNRYAPHVRINNEIHHSKITYR